MERPNARDLVRRRRGDYRAPDTGRHHHLGAAPEAQPVLGAGSTETSLVQLAERTPGQLVALRERYAERMAAASAALAFEEAGAARDALSAVAAELARRSSLGASQSAAASNQA